MVAYTHYESDNRVRRYAEALAKRGDVVDVLALKQPGKPDIDELKGVRIYRLQSRVLDESTPITYLIKLLLFMGRSAVKLAWNCRNGRYDVVHVHSVPDFEVFAALIPKLLGSKIVLDIHDIVPELYASKFNKGKDSLVFKVLVLLEKLSIAFSDHVIIANHLWYDTLLSRSVCAGKCTVVLNYPDISIFGKIPKNRDDGKFVLIYPGSLGWHQGLDVAITAFSKIAGKFPQAVFHIYGSGNELDKLMDLAKKLRMEEKVLFKGSCTMEGIAEAIANADVGIVPKRAVSFGNEAFSTKILEFMAVGVPVIASSTKIDRYYFDDSNILFFISEDVDDLAEKMEMTITQSELRDRLVENGDAYIKLNNWNVKRKEYFNLLEALLPQGNSGVTIG
jgi:glycosyltransferase involved in cell wall biosynthesis